MSEIKGDFERKIIRKAWNLSADAKRTYMAINWRTSHEARSAREELLKIKNAIQIDPDNPPSILKLDLGEEDYISVRRKEGDDLFEEKNAPDVYNSETVFKINVNLIPDQAIGILVVPSGVECQNQDILDRYPPDNSIHRLNLIFEDAMYHAIPYKPSDWKIISSDKTLIKRKGNKFYRLGLPGDLGSYIRDKYDLQETISSVQSDTQGVIELGSSGGYLSQTELDIKRQWYKTRARFYVLVKGSSSSHKVQKIALPQLKPAEATQ